MRPNKVKIGHAVLPIKYHKESGWKGKDYPMDKAGLSWWSGQEIHIRLEQEGEALGEAALKETLLHEILHMCWAVANMDGQGKVAADDLEEWTVSNLSFPLMQVMVDNPKVFAYLMQ